MAKPKMKKKAIRLRKMGWSYSEISEEVSVSKSTLSNWLSGISLTDKQKRRLAEKEKKNQKRFVEFLEGSNHEWAKGSRSSSNDSNESNARDKDNYNDYMREYMRKRYDDRRSRAIKYLGGECSKCGKINDLEFDHIDPSTKEKTIAKMCAGASKERFWNEVEKCQLLCRDCHIIKTARERDYNQNAYLFQCPQCSDEFEVRYRKCCKWFSGEQNLKFCSHSCSAKFYGNAGKKFTRKDNLIGIVKD